MKNLVLKGNPVYPLMDHLFAFLHGGRETLGFLAAGDAPRGGGYSLIGNRMQVYGETIWEILLLPIRIFFEGRDHVPQHFDGVLNPIFALAMPLAFIGSRRGHRGFLLVFVLFVFVFSALAADLRIRYILPILPFVTILAVLGLRNVLERLQGHRAGLPRAVAGAVLAGVALFVGMNLLYLERQCKAVQPVPYLLGRESRDDFLSRQVGSYPAMDYINRTLPEDAVVYLLYLSGRGYYLDRDYIHHVGMEAAIVKAMVRSSADAETLRAFLRSMGGTHLLVRQELMLKALEDNLPAESAQVFLERLALCADPVYEKNGHAVYRIR